MTETLAFMMFVMCIIFWVVRCSLRTLERNKVLWETYAIAQEAVLDCIEDLDMEMVGEGCGTRAKRRAKLLEQRSNARAAAEAALEQLIKVGEYV